MGTYGLPNDILWGGRWGHLIEELFLLKEFCCVYAISWLTSIEFVITLSLISLRQSQGVFLVGLNIFLCILWVWCLV